MASASIARSPWLKTLALLAAVATFAGCKKEPAAPTAGGTTPAAATAGEIVIGHYGSLTGGQATFGRSTDEGILLAVNEVNAAGGLEVAGVKRKVKLVSEDTESKAEKAGDVVRKLISKDNVVAVLGEVASSITLEGAPVAQRAKIPTITPSSTNTTVTEVGDYVFRVCFIDPFQGYAGAKFVREQLKLTKAALLVDKSSAYSDQLSKEFAQAFQSMGGTIVATADYTQGEKDFNTRLTSLREKGPELIYIPGYYTEVANIAIQARALGMNIPLMGGDGWDSEDLAKNGGAAIEGTFYTNHYAPDNPTPAITAFVTKYGAAYNGKVPDGLAALGYDAANVLFASIKTAGTTEGPKLRDAIAQTKGFVGVTGTITIDANRNAVKPIVVLERKNNAWVYRATIEPK
jgi:branched-chain amino acid transport system substrate-binding protein